MKRKLFIFTMVLSTIISCTTKKVDEIKLFPVKNEKQWFFIDKTGKIEINPQFTNANLFSENLAKVSIENEKKELFGFIDETGKIIINYQYEDATDFSEGLAWIVMENGFPSVIDKEGKLIFSLSNAESVCKFSENLAAFSEVNMKGEEVWGFVDKTGKVVVNCQFKDVGFFKDGLCAIRNDENKWGYIDNSGKIVVNPQFDYALSFVEGSAIVNFGDKWGVIDKSGKYTINPQFDGMGYENKGLYICKLNNRYGWCDSKGKIVINPQFDYVFPFTNTKFAAVCSDKKWGYIDNEGKYVINPQFDFATKFYQDIAIVEINSKYGFINRDGKYIINPQYDGISMTLTEKIRTRIFCPDIIANSITINNPEDLSFESSFTDIMKKYELEEDDFSKYAEYKILSEDKPLTNNANITFAVFGSPFRSYTEGYYYTYTSYRFEPSRKISGFAYVIELKNNGKGKVDIVLESFEKRFSEFDKKVEEKNHITYKTNTEKITIIPNDKKDMITITINKLK